MSLYEMVKHVQETVSTTYIARTYKCNGPYEMLVSLQKRLKPKKDERQREIINTINTLNDNPKRTQIDAWLQEYEKAYTAAIEEEIPGFNAGFAIEGFLQAAGNLNRSILSSPTSMRCYWSTIQKRSSIWTT